jgi:hypothetical protein
MKSYWAIAVENILITVCFALVAIFTNHWWVILFAFAGYSYIKFISKLLEKQEKKLTRVFEEFNKINHDIAIESVKEEREKIKQNLLEISDSGEY